jgi:hypothetical protein
MADYLISSEVLEGAADAIREKTGETGKITPINWPAKIRSIEGGGGGGAGLSQLLDRSVSGISQEALSGISEIGPYACYGCKNLTSITIPANVGIVKTGAFAECSTMSEVSFDDSVRSEASAFKNCTALEKVDAYSLESWCNSSFEDEYANPLYYASELLIAGAELSGEIYIPDGVTTIPKYAFKGCKDITSVVIPESVELIEAYAFKDCDGLTSVTFEDTSGWYAGGASLNVADPAAAAVLLKTTYVGKDIGQNMSAAVYEVSKDGTYATVTGYIGTPTNLVIADTHNGVAVTAIAGRAFYNCKSLNTIRIPASISYIGEDAFYWCFSLSDVYVTDLAAWYSIKFTNGYSNPLCYARNLYLNNTLVTELEIPNTVTSINDYAFYGCDAFTSVNFSASVTSIGSGVFTGCASLATVAFEAGSKLTSIGSRAFHNCNKLTSINIPASVTSIGDGAFNGCGKITSIKIPSGVNSIGTETFYWCSSLKAIEIPAGVTTIGVRAFHNCSDLASVTFAENSQLTSIGNEAFRYCNRLTSINIPASVTGIGDSAFRGSSKLTSIELPSSVTSIGNSAFYECALLASVTVRAHTPPVLGTSTLSSTVTQITVPRGTREAYINATNWSAYAEIIVEGDV